MFKQLFNKTVKEIKDIASKNSSTLRSILAIFVAIDVLLIFLIAIFGFMYCIYYVITWVMFWLFGPTIFGITMSWKTPLMLWFVVFIASRIFRGR